MSLADTAQFKGEILKSKKEGGNPLRIATVPGKRGMWKEVTTFYFLMTASFFNHREIFEGFSRGFCGVF